MSARARRPSLVVPRSMLCERCVAMTDSSYDGGERMLIDGQLTQARSGKAFGNINPATEESLGVVADAAADDMQDAITAARRAFDKSAWSTDRKLRKRCLQQLQDALDAEREQFRAELVAEAGCPVALTYGPQLDAPLDDSLR